MPNQLDSLVRTLVLALGALLFVGSRAQADTLPSIYAGLVGGVSVPTDDVDASPYGPAIGARAGLTIPTTDIYVGGLVLYHLGDTPVDSISANTLMVSAEGGYELSLGPIVFRPNVGLGFASQSVSFEAGGIDASIDTSEGSFYISPGINVMLKMLLLVGAELRYNALLNDNTLDSVSVLGTLGFAI